MESSRKIQTSQLDFDGIKNNLKTFLSGQNKYSDYNFEGSGLSVLLDVLAYNTTYNALYMNLAVNEAFLDSASKRNSVVSKAKELGYTPTSSKTAHATIRLTIRSATAPNGTVVILPKYTKFNGYSDTVKYQFYTADECSGTFTSGTCVIDNIELLQGTVVTNTFNVTADTVKFIIPNSKADLDSISVRVYAQNNSIINEKYQRADTIYDVTSDSKVFFVTEIADNKLEVSFGNGVIGYVPPVGSVVTVTYNVTSGSAANNSVGFSLDSNISPYSDYTVTTLTAAFGGSDAETIESIKFNAPRAYTAQNRCITIEDFKTVIKSQYPNAYSINAWGGEQNNPPQYGKVFISVKPAVGTQLADQEKTYIVENILKPRCAVSITPEFVDPTYLNVQLNTSFYYNSNTSALSGNQLKTYVIANINQYNTNVLNQFGGILKYSALSRVIENTDTSISSSISTLLLYKTVVPRFNESFNYIIDIGNPIYNSGVAENSVLSNGIVIPGGRTVYFEDQPIASTGRGSIRMFEYAQNGSKNYIRNNAGTVDYTKGIVTLNNVIITDYVSTDFRFTFKPQSNDVVSSKNQIVSLSINDLVVTPVIDTTITEKYKFTSSRN